MVGRRGRRGWRLTRTPALFPLFRLRFRGRGRTGHAAQTMGSDAMSVNKALAFKNFRVRFAFRDGGTDV